MYPTSSGIQLSIVKGKWHVFETRKFPWLQESPQLTAHINKSVITCYIQYMNYEM